jgi:hypothetical protein
MFALQAYVRRSNSRLKAFKKATREEFREKFIEFLDSRYNFYTLKSKIDFRQAIDKHFKLLIGVSFCPSEEKEELIFALEKDEAHDGSEIKHRDLNPNELKYILEQDFCVYKIDLKKYEESNR